VEQWLISALADTDEKYGAICRADDIRIDAELRVMQLVETIGNRAQLPIAAQ
jgi:hypothetical protein